MLHLEETVNGTYTGRKLPPFEIKYVLEGEQAQKYGLKEGFCIINW